MAVRVAATASASAAGMADRVCMMGKLVSLPSPSPSLLLLMVLPLLGMLLRCVHMLVRACDTAGCVAAWDLDLQAVSPGNTAVLR